MKQSESSLQQNCIRLFRMMYPKYVLRYYAIPNGGARDKITGAILKREGVIAGVLDTFLSVPRGRWAGMWIEFKTEKGRLSESQERFIEEHKEDYHIVVVRSVEQFMAEVEAYLKMGVERAA